LLTTARKEGLIIMAPTQDVSDLTIYADAGRQGINLELSV